MRQLLSKAKDVLLSLFEIKDEPDVVEVELRKWERNEYGEERRRFRVSSKASNLESLPKLGEFMVVSYVCCEIDRRVEMDGSSIVTATYRKFVPSVSLEKPDH